MGICCNSKRSSVEWKQHSRRQNFDDTSVRLQRGCWWWETLTGTSHDVFVDSVTLLTLCSLKSIQSAGSNLFACVKRPLYTAGHVFLLVQSISINIVNHIWTGLMNMKGTWLTSLALAGDSAKPPQKSLTNHLKILGGQRICTVHTN